MFGLSNSLVQNFENILSSNKIFGFEFAFVKNFRFSLGQNLRFWFSFEILGSQKN
jgi:hypothetical protein